MNHKNFLKYEKYVIFASRHLFTFLFKLTLAIKRRRMKRFMSAIEYFYRQPVSYPVKARRLLERLNHKLKILLPTGSPVLFVNMCSWAIQAL